MAGEVDGGAGFGSIKGSIGLWPEASYEWGEGGSGICVLS